MKKFMLIISMFVLAATAIAGDLPEDGRGNRVQASAPNGLLSRLLTVRPTTINMTNDLWWSLYSPTACKVRFMPYSSAGLRGAIMQHTATADGTMAHAVNRYTPFINFSGCTSGELKRH